MRFRRFGSTALLAAVSFCTWKGQAQGQQKARLAGVVTDATGAAIPEADVTVFSGTAVIAHVRSDRRGRFTFSGLSQDYAVDVSAPTFKPLHEAVIPFTYGSLSHFTLQNSQAGQRILTPGPQPTVQAGQSGLAESPVHEVAHRTPLEYGVLFQGGVGLTENRNSFRFLLAGAHLGKVLTPELGTGLFRGNFEYAGEFFPYWQSFTPQFPRIRCAATTTLPVNPNTCSAPYTVGGTYTGLSVTPIILRWNFTHGRRWMPWAQAAGGLLWTNHKYPGYGDINPQDVNETGPSADTSVWNFTPQGGVGMHVFVKPRRSVDFSANAVHISSASLGDRNPGVNASVQFSLGYSWWK